MARHRSSLSVLAVSLSLGAVFAGWISSCTSENRDFSSGSGATSSSAGSGGAGGSGAGEGGSGGASGSGGAGGSGGCDPAATPAEDSCVVTDELGIFVTQAGNDVNPGTKVAPVKTLAHAIDLAAASKKRVYACIEAFNDPIVVPSGVEIYGGLDCNDGWAWVGDKAKTTIATGADTIPARLLGGMDTTRLEDLWIQAGSSVKLGSSSIAVLADGATAEITRCKLVAGDGANGTNGLGAPLIKPPAGSAGIAGMSECQLLINPGAVSVTNSKCSMSVSGAGGSGTLAGGTAGGSGLPALGGGMGGKAGCTPGLDGAAGPDGAPGPGGAGPGILTGKGYFGQDGGAGAVGEPGQGGGGGGGVSSNAPCGISKGGASGGSGGSGGCGGAPGGGGMAGGASIALAMVDGSIKVTDSEIVTGKGGAGGTGGNSQGGGIGGFGGAGGSGTPKACAGGSGGHGGAGGPGGGGKGGSSFGIAYTVGAPTVSGMMFSIGLGGTGGLGGENNSAGNAGEDGAAVETQAVGG